MVQLKTKDGKQHTITVLRDLYGLLTPRSCFCFGYKSGQIFIGSLAEWQKVRPLWESFYKGPCADEVFVWAKTGKMPKTFNRKFISFDKRPVERITIRDLVGEPKMFNVTIPAEESGKMWLLSEYGMVLDRFQKAYEDLIQVIEEQQIDRSVFYDTFGYVPDPTLYHKPEDKHDD